MWQNFSNKFIERKGWMGIVLPVWVIASFILVQVVVSLLFILADNLGLLGGINPAILSTVTGAVVYTLTLLMVIGLPMLVKNYRTTKKDVGLEKLPTWIDLLLAPAGFLVYIFLSAMLILLATQFFTFFDADQVQDTGFNQLGQGYEYLLAFVTLVIIAPVAEEILFRGYLFGKLMKHMPIWVAILITSALFGLAHGAWNVGIDVFALSIVLCLLRLTSKSLWPAILLHMMKNGLAFYLLFINPTLLSTLGG